MPGNGPGPSRLTGRGMVSFGSYRSRSMTFVVSERTKPNTPLPLKIPRKKSESVCAGGGTQYRVRAVPFGYAVSANGTRIKSALPSFAKRIESTPTP